ncbi:MAG TPA: sensor histidine kinase [Corynebacterium sp.]|nr:sensor histidine kinase [Corynebacterium sp.]
MSSPLRASSPASEEFILNETALRKGIHLLTLMLLAVTVASSFTLEFLDAALNLLLVAIFAVFYFVGFDSLAKWSEVWRQMWVVAMTGVWILNMLVSPVAIYLIFSLYFVLLRAMDDLRGGLSVIFVTAIAIVLQTPNGVTLGSVMGPTVASAVTLAMHYAVRILQRLTREREQAVQALVRTRNQLAESERSAGVVQERQRLAHEIHDTVAQGLSSIQMLLHVAERDLRQPEPAAEHIESALERIELARSAAADNLAEARAMIAALQPASLAQTSLSGAIERMVDSFARVGEINIDVDVEGETGEGGPQLPMKVEAALLRIAQGAVGNVVKHAGATRCRVTVTYLSDEVRLDVVDNGCGFDVEAVESRPAGLGHVGLSAMRLRAQELGGELVVESAPGGPTAVSAAIPLALPGAGADPVDPETVQQAVREQ